MPHMSARLSVDMSLGDFALQSLKDIAYERCLREMFQCIMDLSMNALVPSARVVKLVGRYNIQIEVTRAQRFLRSYTE